MTLLVRGDRRGPRWTRLAHGLYVPAEPAPPLPVHLQAWRLLLPEGAVFTHLTAAALRGWWLPAECPRPVFAAVPEGGRHPHRAGLVVIRPREPPVVEVVDGVPVATAPETLLAAARDLHVLDLVPMADSALRLGACTVEELRALAAQRRRGAPMLRRILPLLDARSESAWESVLRVLHHVAAVPVEPQHVIRDDAGRFVARADLWLVGTRRLHEYDGEVHRDRDTHRADLARDRRLVETSWSVAATPLRRCSAEAASSPPPTPSSAVRGRRSGSGPGAGGGRLAVRQPRSRAGRDALGKVTTAGRSHLVRAAGCILPAVAGPASLRRVRGRDGGWPGGSRGRSSASGRSRPGRSRSSGRWTWSRGSRGRPAGTATSGPGTAAGPAC